MPGQFDALGVLTQNTKRPHHTRFYSRGWARVCGGVQMMQPLEQQRDGERVFPRYDRHVTNTSPSRSLSSGDRLADSPRRP